LTDEAEVLSVLQQKALKQLDEHNQRERAELEQKIEIRLLTLNEKVELT